MIIHISFWLFYTAQSAITYPHEYIEKYGFWNIAFKQTLIQIALLIVFYINYLVLLPQILSKNRYLRFALSNFLLLIFGVFLSWSAAKTLDLYFNAGTFFLDDFSSNIPFHTLRIFFYMLLSIGARFAIDWFKYQQKILELQEQKKHMELQMLRYQINPHFIFNTLNNIYSLLLQNSDKAKDALMRFSELMRYQLSKDIESETIPLESEIKYINSFIELQKLRMVDGNIIRFEIEGDPAGKQIAPLLIVPFVENAFKHGKTNKDSSFDFTLKITDDFLEFYAKNEKSMQKKDDTSGIGIANVKKRLALMYENKAELKIIEDECNFYVYLTLKDI